MAKRKILEQRKHPRITKNLPVSISLKDIDFVTETKNISCGGAYCHVDKYIKPMTRLSVCLDISNTQEKITCKGVVVRTEEAAPTGYNIAIFFTEISKKNLDTLKNYFQQHVSL